MKNFYKIMNKTDKVAILGKLISKYKAPFDDYEWDIWTLNHNSQDLPRIDLWFDIHLQGTYPGADITRANYPFEEAEKLVGGQYYNNSISYMIAYAILKGYKEIALYGMNFQSDGEQRRKEYQNVRELIFFAKGKGIKVTAPCDEIMLHQYKLYGI